MIGDNPTTRIDLMTDYETHNAGKGTAEGQRGTMAEITKEQLDQITGAVRAGLVGGGHACRFSDEDRANMHEFCGVLRDGGVDAVREMVALSKQIAASKKIAGVMIITALVGGAITIVVTGIRATIASIR